jgi:hypothetical protein
MPRGVTCVRTAIPYQREVKCTNCTAVVLRHHDNRRPPPRNVNAPWLIERGQAHASLGWDISEA